MYWSYVLDKKFLQTFIPRYYILKEGGEGEVKREVGWREKMREERRREVSTHRVYMITPQAHLWK